MQKKPDAALSKAASDLEAELARLEDTLDELKSPITSEKALLRAGQRLEQCSACEERLAGLLQNFAQAMIGMQERQQRCMEILAERADGVQARHADRNQLIERINQLGQRASQISSPIASLDESAWASPTSELLSSLAELNSRLESVIEEAGEVAASARQSDWNDVARDADTLKQQLQSARSRLLLGQRQLASRAPS